MRFGPKCLAKFVFAAFILTIQLEYSASVSIDNFFPFGTENGDSVAIKGDDIFTGPLPLRFHYPFFNDTHSSLFVNVNGAISFRSGISQFTPTCGAIDRESAMIAPFWGDVDTRRGGDLFFRESTNRTLLAKATDEIQRAFPELWGVNSAWLFIATWHEVGFYGSSSSCGGTNKRNTFQLTLATDGSSSFAIFYYNKLQWTTGTSSGGNCSGLGGNPAKSGFDVGDGRTFYQLPGSCTNDVLKVSETSNMNSPGKWIFRVDSAFESSGCDSDKYETEKFRMSPSFVSSLGHVAVTISGPCLDTTRTAICRFNDLNNSTTNVTATLIRSSSLAICEVPFLYSYGRLKVDLIVQEEPDNRERMYEGYIYVQEAHTDIIAEAEVKGGDTLLVHLTWDPLLFFEDTIFDLVLMEVPSATGKWNETRVLVENVDNTGTYDLNLALQGLHDIVAFQLKLKYELNSAFSNPLLGLSSYGDPQIAQGRCSDWYKTDSGPPSKTDIEPCPPLLEQAERDFRFEVEIYSYPTLQYYHPTAVASYRQRTANNNGAGQQCVYSSDGHILVGPSSGGHVDFSSPVHALNILGHTLNDLLPWTFCCKKSQSEAHCRKYYEKRPSDGGDKYVPPRPGGGSGDPHIQTFDLATYSFNGLGEFWMIKSPGFSMQSRMEQFVNSSGNPTPASIFTAFVMDDNTTRIQVQLARSNNLDILLDGEIVTFDPGQNRILTQTANIEKRNSTLDITYTKGFTFSISAAEGALGLLAAASESNKNRTKGLLGVFDGNPDNDLTSPDGSTIPVNSTLRVIHENFGVKWYISHEESLFVYPRGKNYSDFYHPDFQPNFDEPDMALLPPEVNVACNGSRDCLFDFFVTGDLAFANQTRAQEEKLNETVSGLEEEVPMCQPILSLANGFVTTTNFFLGSSVTFDCDPEYRLVGPKVIHCIDGIGGGKPRWSASLPRCVALKYPNIGGLGASLFLGWTI